MNITSLDITGHDGKSVPNTFLRQKDGSKELGIVLPGRGYAATMPLLYYSTDLLAAYGADVLMVEYSYGPEVTPERFGAVLTADVLAAYDAVMAASDYSRVTIVGKSIGTIAMAILLEHRPAVREADLVWLTPLVKLEQLRQTIARFPHRAMFVVGTADAHYDPALYDEVVASVDGRSLVIDGAHHGLEIDGDTLATIDILKRMILDMEEFLNRE